MPPRMTRKQVADFLCANGFPIAYSTLEKLCAPAVGDGPPVDSRWGRRSLYDPAAALAWAKARLRPANREPEAA
jgi:hypothetical protein